MRLLRRRDDEDRNLSPPSVDPHLPLATGPPLMDVTASSALRVADAYACVRALADAVASLPLHAYRRTPAGRVPAGDDSRIVRLLTRPAPGSTLPDFLSHVMVHLNVHGEAFVGKYRSACAGATSPRSTAPRSCASSAPRPPRVWHRSRCRSRPPGC